MRSLQVLQQWLSRELVAWRSGGMKWPVLRHLIEYAPTPICVVHEQRELIVLANDACRTVMVANAHSAGPLSLLLPQCGKQLLDAATRRALDLGRICWLAAPDDATDDVRAESRNLGWLAWRVSLYGSRYILLIGCTVAKHPPLTELAHLKATIRAKDEFLTELVHELRGPLAPIETAIALLRGPRSDVHERALNALERQAQHMKRLIQDLSELTRGGPAGLSLKLERVELAAVIDRAIELSLPLASGRRHRILVDVPQGLLIEADLVRLVQVFSNLITNASKYTHREGRIRITARAYERQARVRIIDNGIGISEEVLPRIFDLFVRSPRAQHSEGLGVGLHLVRALVEQHGGTVAARSDGPGCGSEFTVSLPLVQPQTFNLSATAPAH